MTISDSSNDHRSHERMPTRASTHSDEQQDLLGECTSGSDDDLDLEVNRFLESDFFADHGYAIVSSQQQHISESTASSLQEELLFMDIDGSIDMPDLDFGDATPQTPITTPAEARGPSSSLRVHIPASALFGPSVVARPSQSIQKAARSTSTTRSKRRKDEMEYLRQQVQDFEDQLERLRRDASPSGGGCSPPNSSSSSSSSSESRLVESAQHPARWERIAKNQKSEKQKSEAENAKLKRMLESQLKVARSLSKVLRKSQDISWLEASPPGSLFEATENGESNFEFLEVQVETLSGQLDSVLDGISGLDLKMDGHSDHVKTDESGSFLAEVVDSTAFPFDVHTVGAAIWKLMSASSLNFANRTYQTSDATDDIIHAQVSLSMRLLRHDTSIKMWLVGKRIIEADRMVFVWSAMGDTTCSLFGAARVKVRESAWTLVRAEPRTKNDGAGEIRNTDDQCEPSTSVLNVVRMVLEIEPSGDSSRIPEDHLGVLTDVVLNSIHQNLAIMGQMIENIVLGDATSSANE